MPRSWSFQTKSTATLAILALLAVLAGGWGFVSLRAVGQAQERAGSVSRENLADLVRIEAERARTQAAWRGLLLTGEYRFTERRTQALRELGAALDRLEDRGIVPAQRALLLELRRGLHTIAALEPGAVSGRSAAARSSPLDGEAQMQEQLLVRPLREYQRLEQEQAGRRRAEAERLAAWSRAGSVLLALAGLGLGGLAVVLLPSSLSRQIGSVLQRVQSSSAELQSAATQQASGSKEAATVMNEIAATMSALLVTARQITETALSVSHMARESSQAVEAGDRIAAMMKEAIELIRRQVDVIVGHMLELGRKSQQIGEILDIINELADQANILAINASIEAAGAGEAGRRFAVVGEETRRLADRVSGSIKESRRLVDEVRAAVNTTVMATEGGSKAVDAGLQHFEEVVRGLHEVSRLVVATQEAARQIELSTQQQSTAVEQVNAAVAGATQSSREAEISSGQMLQTATELARMSHDLSMIARPAG